MKLPIQAKVFFGIKKWVLVVLGTVAFGLASEPLHPIHISRTTMYHNRATGALEISMQIFVDDLETSIRPEGFPPLNIGLENEHPATDSLLLMYLGEHFVLQAEGQQLGVYFIGREQKDEATWMYMVVSNYKEVDAITVHYAVLMNLYGDQRNILSLIEGEEQRSLMFTIGEETQVLEME